MESIFRVPWDSVALEDVRAFLADAGNEPLTWEAKGTELLRKERIRKHVCGFANAVRGGYLILGAEQHEMGGWEANGIAFPGGEAIAWLDQTIRDGLRPVPDFDLKEWPTEAGRHIAVAQVPPVAIPPCMTTSGDVFERVAGRTIPVQDPVELRRLFERGESALATAEQRARRASGSIVLGEPEPPFLIIILGLAPTGVAEDISAHLFTEAFGERVLEAFRSLPERELIVFEDGLWPGEQRPFRLTVGQDFVLAYGLERRNLWHVRAAWDGSVAVSLTATPEPEEEIRRQRVQAETIFMDVLRPAADAASALVIALGGYGVTHVTLRVRARFFELAHQPYAGATIPGPDNLGPIERRTPGDPTVDDRMLASMQREFLRACGIRAWEPAAPEDPAREAD